MYKMKNETTKAPVYEVRLNEENSSEIGAVKKKHRKVWLVLKIIEVQVVLLT